MKPNYCTQKSVARCIDCSLSNYGRDCHNNKIEFDLSGNIRNARESADMTQAELAKAIKTTQAMIHRYEWGEQEPTVSRLIDIAKALKIKPSKLID
jgi:ribosome-binding protein aMBF1 (putative translation factor)